MESTFMSDGSERMRYRDPAIPLYIVQGDLISLRNMVFLAHWHEDIELVLCLKGYQTYNVNGQSIRVDEGCAIFVNARQLHSCHTTDGTDCQYRCVCFRPELLYANTAIRDRFVLPILTNPQLPWLMLRPENPAHAPLLDILRALPSEAGREMEALGLLQIFWQGLYGLSGSLEAEGESAHVQTLRRMLSFIRTHYQERITLQDIAEAGGVCRSKGCQLFRECLQTTPNEYLNSFRLEKSMELLTGTVLSITAIAQECGFSSGSYFAELFAKCRGCSPTAYRSTARNAPPASE